jgi:hypothetical protein
MEVSELVNSKLAQLEEEKKIDKIDVEAKLEQARILME